MPRELFIIMLSIMVAHGRVDAGDDRASTPPMQAVSDPQQTPLEPPAPAASPTGSGTAHDGDHTELIEVTGSAPVAPGTIALDARTARDTPGALGEPLRALASLPGVTTSLAASGYPIIRGTLPGESRFTFDDIELPILYHFVLGNQVIHPSFLGDLELRAGGSGVEQGNLIGGLVTMTPASPDRTRTELRANPVEIGAYRFQALSDATSAAVAARVGTLALVKVYKPDHDLYYVDQQTRIVHRLANGDQLTLTSLGAFDYFARPDVGIKLQSDLLGFHRLDGRWTRTRNGDTLRAGIQTQLDSLRSRTVYEIPPALPDVDPGPPPSPKNEGGASYGVRGYADGSLALTPRLRVRGGIEARHRVLVNGKSPFTLSENPDPYLGLARKVDAGGAWAALDLRIANLTITPGIRSDLYRAALYGASTRHITIDPRLAVQAYLPRDARAEASVGMYSAPPQVSLFRRSTVIGPLPMTDGIGSNAGMNRAIQVNASLRTPVGAGMEGRFALYYHDTHRALDFGAVDGKFLRPTQCTSFAAPYRDLDTRAVGAEVMLRRELSRSVTGWLSYSLAKLDRDFGFVELPGDFDQRHTLNATAQWRRGRWLLGATGHLHSSRALQYPQTDACGFGGMFTSLDALRRPSPNWRIDLRAERAFQFATWRLSLYADVQNASLTKEIVGYAEDPLTRQVLEQTVFLPLALIGLEAVL
jgi:hypothetical protein